MPEPMPVAIIIYGASGDLSQLKLVPAIYELAREKLLSDKFVLVGYARSTEKKDPTTKQVVGPMNDEQYRKDVAEAIRKHARHKPVDEELVKRIQQNVFYVAGQYDSPEDQARLAGRLEFEPLPDALRRFADDVDHPTCDFVVAGLITAAEKEARDLTPLLAQLAACARDGARPATALRRRRENSRRARAFAARLAREWHDRL